MSSFTESDFDRRNSSRRIVLPHLIPASIALFALVLAMVIGNSYANSLEDEYVHTIAPLWLHQTVFGSVTQEAALRQSDLLPVLGSSEMSLGAYEYRSFDFFSTYPTGFEVFDINNGGATSLNILEDIGALGPALKGKKVVISFTTDMFNDLEVPPKTYAGSFSQMHANALIFNQDLSLSLKQKIAKRMLDYPDTLTDPVLIFALQNLASGSAWNDFLYYLTVPLGKLEDLIIRLQDHYEVWSYINLHPQINPNVTRNPRNIDWTALLAQATAQQKAATSSNPYGIENDAWNKNYHGYLRVHKPGSSNQKFLTAINNSKEWYDLELELEVLQELGVRPLIMSRPVNGGLFTANGVTPEVQAVYYSRLEKLVSTYHMPLMDFKGYTNDPYFSIDEAAHTGREGWVVIDQTLDAFFHGKLSVEH